MRLRLALWVYDYRRTNYMTHPSASQLMAMRASPTKRAQNALSPASTPREPTPGVSELAGRGNRGSYVATVSTPKFTSIAG